MMILLRASAAISLLGLVTNTPAVGVTNFCKVKGVLQADRSVQLDSRRYSNRRELKSYLTEYRRKFPTCVMSLDADHDVDLKMIEKTATIFHEAGFGTVGFLTEPQPVK